MKLSINKFDKTNDVLVFIISMLYVSTIVFMALTKQYEASEMRNNIAFFGTKTSMLLSSIVMIRSCRGIIAFFAMALFTVCCVNLANELLYVFKICDTDSYLLIFIETIIVLLSLLIYRTKHLWSK